MSLEYRTAIKNEILKCIEEKYSPLYEVTINMHKLLSILKEYETLEAKCDELEDKLSCLIDYISEGKYSKPEYDLQSLKEIHDNAIHDALEELEAKCKIYEDALKSMDIQNLNDKHETNYVIAQNALEKAKV